MSLAWPWFALALVLPLLVRFGLPPWRRGALSHPGFALLRSHTGLPLGRAALIWCALILALCRPQWWGEPVIQYEGSRDLLLAVDLSDSMRTLDILDNGEQLARLTAVRPHIKALIAKRAGDRVGLIVFADHAYLLSPLTQEITALLTLSDELDFNLVGRTTALGEAILLARQHSDPDRPTALILVTDGRNTAGNADPKQQAQFAAAQGIRIYTLGVGADPDTFIQPYDQINPSMADPSSELDEPLLNELAQIGGGRYFRARSQLDLEAINQILNQLEPAPLPVTRYQPLIELYPWPLALMWLLLILPASSGTLTSRRLVSWLARGAARWS